MKHAGLQALKLTAIFCMLLLAAGCARQPDEQRIRGMIDTMQHALQTHDLHDFVDGISDDFTGNQGEFDRAALANMLRIDVLRNDQTGVLLGPIDIEMQGDRATVKLTATLTGGSGGLIPDHAAIYSIVSAWKREGRVWRCYNAIWKQDL